MLKASALIYAVVLSIVILLITVFLVTSLYDSQITAIRIKNMERANDNLESTMQLLLHTDMAGKQDESYAIDLYGDGKEKVNVSKRKWGVFDLFSIKTEAGNKQLSKQFVIGYNPMTDYCINITASNRVLNIGGRTLINGDAYIPEATFKRAYIEGRGSLLPKPINGSIKASGLYTHTIDLQKMADQIEQSINNTISQSISDESIVQEGKNSFTNNTIVLYSQSDIHLSSISLKGNYILKSDTKINVNSTSHLEDVILVAPEIVIQNGFVGTLQCFASRKLIVGQDSKFLYPSILSAINTDNADSTVEVQILDDVIIAGEVFAIGSKGKDNNPIVTINTGVKIYGQVYNTGYTQTNGTIKGNMQTGSFYLRTKSAVYDNTLLDAEIDVRNMDTNYCSFLSGRDDGKKIVKWMY
jgi:hypothetical protein